MGKTEQTYGIITENKGTYLKQGCNKVYVWEKFRVNTNIDSNRARHPYSGILEGIVLP